MRRRTARSSALVVSRLTAAATPLASAVAVSPMPTRVAVMPYSRASDVPELMPLLDWWEDCEGGGARTNGIYERGLLRVEDQVHRSSRTNLGPRTKCIDHRGLIENRELKRAFVCTPQLVRVHRCTWSSTRTKSAFIDALSRRPSVPTTR